MSQKIFRQPFLVKIAKQIRGAKHESLIALADDKFRFEGSDVVVSGDYPDLSLVSLAAKSSGDGFQFQNATRLYEALRISPYLASDPRLWAYLAIDTFASYMSGLRPIKANNQNFMRNPGDYVLTHYVCPGSSPKDLLLHDIALLWWIPHLTVQESSEDKYRLTREIFSMLDYTRHLLQGTQGRSPGVRHAVLEYVVENPDLFSRAKAEKVRLIMRRLNLKAGVRLFPMLSKGEVKTIIASFRSEIQACVAT